MKPICQGALLLASGAVLALATACGGGVERVSDTTSPNSVTTEQTAPITPTSEPTTEAPATPSSEKFGVPVSYKGPEGEKYTVTVTGPVKVTKGGEWSPPKNGAFVIFTVTFHNTGTVAVSYNPFDFSLVGSDGQKYPMALFMEEGYGQDLNSGDLPSGRLIKGKIVYDATLHGILGYEPNFGDMALSEWKY